MRVHAAQDLIIATCESSGRAVCRCGPTSFRSDRASSITPPSELILPPSKAALIFFVQTGGNEEGRVVSLFIAGGALVRISTGLASATESYAPSTNYATTLASLIKSRS
jgi:hypothetical protein